MDSRTRATIDPADAATRLGADGKGIVWAVVATGVEGSHPHFLRYDNLSLPAPLHHRDFTLAFAEGHTEQEPLDEALLSDEALIDVQGHGTHVAGLIAGYSDVADKTVDWGLEEPLFGIAPRCKVLSLKVFGEGAGDERAILAALRYVASVNAAAGALLIHGVVLPLGMQSDMVNYACGETPVCQSVNALVEAGVVVVVAAGNEGQKGLSTILDPGNAERAITVGATHPLRPHQYGASYFSSRGPTADGRVKPDLVAPGEKILSAAPTQGRDRSAPQKSRRKTRAKVRRVANYRSLDGTSMAAAQVAGVVAAILSVRPTLIGRPDEVKKLLTETATDLRRERYCQGHGLVNLSRALGEKVQADVAAPASDTRVDAAMHTPPAAIIPALQEQPAVRTQGAAGGKRFAVAFSFAGEHDDYIQRVWMALRRVGQLARRSIFYHKQFEAELSRLDLDLYLQDLYSNQTELIVVFLSAHYEKKQWTRLEWRAMREIIKQQKSHSLLIIRFDDTHIPGLFSLDGYISAVGREPEDIADLILDRLYFNREQGLI